MAATRTALDAATVKRLLTQYAPLLERAARRHPWLDRHELRAVWEDAICEAARSHDATRSAEAGWIQRIFYYRLAQLIDREITAKEALGRSLGTDPKVLNGVSPEKAFLESSVMAEVLKLPPRQQIILIAWAHGYTYAEVAAQVGVNLSTAYYDAQRALETLQERFGLGDKDRS